MAFAIQQQSFNQNWRLRALLILRSERDPRPLAPRIWYRKRRPLVSCFHRKLSFDAIRLNIYNEYGVICVSDDLGWLSQFLWKIQRDWSCFGALTQFTAHLGDINAIKSLIRLHPRLEPASWELILSYSEANSEVLTRNISYSHSIFMKGSHCVVEAAL